MLEFAHIQSIHGYTDCQQGSGPLSSETVTNQTPQKRLTPLAPAIFVIVLCTVFTIGAIYWKDKDPYHRYAAQSRESIMEKYESSQQAAAEEKAEGTADKQP